MSFSINNKSSYGTFSSISTKYAVLEDVVLDDTSTDSKDDRKDSTENCGFCLEEGELDNVTLWSHPSGKFMHTRCRKLIPIETPQLEKIAKEMNTLVSEIQESIIAIVLKSKPNQYKFLMNWYEADKSKVTEAFKTALVSFAKPETLFKLSIS